MSVANNLYVATHLATAISAAILGACTSHAATFPTLDGKAPRVIGHRGAPGYELPGDIVAGWGASKGAKDPGRDVIGDFNILASRTRQTPLN